MKSGESVVTLISHKPAPYVFRPQVGENKEETFFKELVSRKLQLASSNYRFDPQHGGGEGKMPIMVSSNYNYETEMLETLVARCTKLST